MPRFNWLFASITILGCVAIVAFGLYFVVAKPSFGDHYDCAWNRDSKTYEDCHTPGFSWWGWFGLVPVILACLIFVVLVVLYLVRNNDSNNKLTDTLTVSVVGLIGVIIASIAGYWIYKCLCYPFRRTGSTITECGDETGPRCVPYICCWSGPLWIFPVVLSALFFIRAEVSPFRGCPCGRSDQSEAKTEEV